MPRSTRLLIALAAAAALLTTITALRPAVGPDPRPGPSPAPEPEPEPLRLRLEPGQVARYAFEIDSEQHSNLGVAIIEGRAQLAGQLELAVAAVERRGEGAVAIVTLRFPAVRVEAWQALGQPIVEPGAEAPLSDCLARFELSDRGAVDAVQVAADTPPACAPLARLVTPLLATRLDDGSAWTTEDELLLGRASTAWRRGDPLEVEQVGRTYHALHGVTAAGPHPADSTARYALDRRGLYAALEGEELIALEGQHPYRVRTRWSMRRVETSRGAVALPATGWRSAAVGNSPADRRRQLLIAQADGMTAAELLGDLGDRAGALSHRWMYRATGLLTLDPTLAGAVGAIFEQDGISERGRGFVLDLLASAGHSAAQAELRRLLDTPRARRSPRALLFAGRLALLAEPDAQTVDWLGDRQGLDDPFAIACTYALGAAAGRLEGDAAAAIGASLASALEGTDDPAAQRHLIASLGNVGDAAHVATLAPLAESEDPAVRAAVARALRKTASPEAERILDRLADDPASRVQRAARAVRARHAAL